MKSKKNKFALILTLICFFIFAVWNNQAYAQITFENYVNLTENSTKVLQNLKDTALEIESMEKAGFNTTRLNDELLEAKQLFEAQLAIEHRTNTSDYSVVIKKAKFIKTLAKKAFEVNDELVVLKKRIDESEKIIDTTEALAIYENARNEFSNERYDQAFALIDEAYKKISELEAEKTRTRAIITATRGFFEKMRAAWKELLIGTTAIIIIAFLLYDRISIYFIKRKMKMLEFEKKIVKNLIKKTEEDYFEKGNLSETTYHIKMNKFGELIRDINRQIPLLREQLEARRGFFKKLRKAKKEETEKT